MNLKYITLITSFAVFGIVLLPGVPIQVRMTITTVMYIPSIFASGSSFYYYHKIPESRYSLLTTSAKSVVAYHMITSTSIYVRDMLMLFSESYKQSWETIPNEKCSWDVSMVTPTFMFGGIAQLQSFRLFMVVSPERFLEMDHSFWAYPITATVPITVCLFLIIAYVYHYSICDQMNVNILFQKFNINIESKNIMFKTVDIRGVFCLMVLGIEILIRIYENWGILTKRLKILKTCCTNAVAPCNLTVDIKTIIDVEEIENEPTCSSKQNNKNVKTIKAEDSIEIEAHETTHLQSVNSSPTEINAKFKIKTTQHDKVPGEAMIKSNSKHCKKSTNSTVNDDNTDSQIGIRVSSAKPRTESGGISIFILSIDSINSASSKHTEIEGPTTLKDKTMINKQVALEEPQPNISNKLYADSPIVITTLLMIILVFFFSFSTIVTILINVLRDIFIWSIPICWVICKPEIKEFANLKFNQWKSRWGYL